jgi:hypothetical protein
VIVIEALFFAEGTFQGMASAEEIRDIVVEGLIWIF